MKIIKLMPHILFELFGKILPDKLWADKLYLKIIFKHKIGDTIDFNHPKTFNEKLQWLKLFDRKPQYTKMVDKCEMKKFIANIIGSEYVIPTLGVWEKFDDIDFSVLPEKFVLKTTHDSGGVIICDDKSRFNFFKAKKEFNRKLKINYYYHGREWPYKNVRPRIIAEKYLVDNSGFELKDYKLLCFNGQVKCSFSCSNRFGAEGLYVNFYDRDWKPMPFERHYHKNPVEIARPISYNKMIELAEKISQEMIFVRIDFYEVNGKPYIGEITFYPGSGLEEFSPKEWDLTLGKWICLPIEQATKKE